MSPKAKAKGGARSRSSSAKAKARPEPKAKSRAEPRAKSTAKAKAKSAASPASPRGAAAAPTLPEKSPEVIKAENLLRECLLEKDIERVDGRVLDIAVAQAKPLDDLDKSLLQRAEARLAEHQAFQVELQRRVEALRERKAGVIAQHDAENEAFAEAVETRQRLKKQVEDLFDAVGDGDLDKVQSIVNGTSSLDETAPLSVDSQDHEGNTALSEAACYGEAEIVEFLLDAGAHPDTRNDQGRTPLWRATYNGHEAVVQFLLENGADATIESHEGVPPGKDGSSETKALIASWERSRTAEMKKGLRPLQRLAAPWPHLLLKACEAGDAQSVQSIVQALTQDAGTQRAKGLLKTILHSGDATDALWMSCTKGHLELCRLLLDSGADVDSCSETGLTCLMIACRKGHTAVAKELLSRGAKTYLRSQQGRLATDYAREVGDGHAVHAVVLNHCHQTEDWSTLEEEARQSSGNAACGVDAIEHLIDPRRNANASAAATAELKALSVNELREGSDRYKDLLEQRALADVLGIG